ncbi:MAG: TIGR04282 family arsenosugar biosynthesis glycosyltransferase [Candidatus Dadabacteria bacterium]|nr:TIGR04282 family arsenosugar biosynthesis glycosyltransferase [Candidatus Dadabacteria bacterium]
MDSKTGNALIVFLKYPVPGRVKTRLADEIGTEKAAAIYKKMAEEVVTNTTGRGKYTSLIFYDPPEAEHHIKRWLSYAHNRYLPQTGADLGERMKNAFEKTFALGFKNNIIIGTDCPGITTGLLGSAFESLSAHDAVIGPANDGGYYLLGLRRAQPELLTGLDWSTNRVFEQTVEKMRKSGLTWHELETLPDIDTHEDLLKLRPDLLG